MDIAINKADEGLAFWELLFPDLTSLPITPQPLYSNKANKNKTKLKEKISVFWIIKEENPIIASDG